MPLLTKNKILSLLFLVIITPAFAQENLTTTKPKNHSISLYVGFSAFENYNNNPRGEEWKTIKPYSNPSFFAISNIFSLTYKYKKHEIIPVIYIANYDDDNNKRKPFVVGGSLSYLYHFNQKPTHLFFEANFQTFFYTFENGRDDIIPSVSSQRQKELITEYQYAANIQTYILNPALGIEVKLWPFTYLQFALGSGAFYTKGKPAIPTSLTSQYSLPDNFRNTYPGVFGANWYGRLSIIVRAFNF